METPTPELHPAQNRALRELRAAVRHGASHWRTLGPRLGGDAGRELVRGAGLFSRLQDELERITPRYGLHGRVAAEGVGARAADARNAVADRLLERNQALRLAVLDAAHVVILLAYVGEVSRAHGPEAIAELCARWEQQLVPVEEALRARAASLGADPDAAIEPAIPTTTGKLGHRIAWTAGAVGEWTDRAIARRKG